VIPPKLASTNDTTGLKCPPETGPNMAGKVCVCELVPLFDLSQPTVSHHLKVLREAGIVGSERQGLWAYYFVIPDALKELSGWLS